MKPEEGSIWKYKNGQLYKVLFLVNTGHAHENHPVEVIYEGGNGLRWSYLLSEWYSNFEPYHDPN